MGMRMAGEGMQHMPNIGLTHAGLAHAGLAFDPAEDRAVAVEEPGGLFNHTLHIYHDNWFGIASASAAMPGHKLRLHADALDEEAARVAARYIHEHDITRVCF